jgi:hypothetical protein
MVGGEPAGPKEELTLMVSVTCSSSMLGWSGEGSSSPT